MADFFDQLGDILFLDIETASLTEKFEELDPRLQEEWIKKERLIRMENLTDPPGSLFFERSGIHSWCARVICSGEGFFQCKKKDVTLVYRANINADPEERVLLLEMKALLAKKKWVLCANNGKEF